MRKAIPFRILCERIVRNGVMWCNTHDRLHSVCQGGPWDSARVVEDPLMEQKEGKILASGCERRFTPSEGEG